jgi:hypothetical protein
VSLEISGFVSPAGVLTEESFVHDYSAVHGGALCAYRYDGETTLLSKKFITFSGPRG